MAADQENASLVFGPVPSRRLGRSLGINAIPPKTCSYGCIYCQLGRTTRMVVEREAFHPPGAVHGAVSEVVDRLKCSGEPLDALAFVPDGEPTLDSRLGEEIESLKSFEKTIAVITNASLLFRPDVREDLRAADWVSVKLDSVDEETWHRVNRPHSRLSLPRILEGILRFAEEFEGRLVTETMLVAGGNDHEEAVERVAAFAGRIDPAVAYITTPIRPPAEPWVGVSSPDVLVAAHEAFAERVKNVELLIEPEGDEFTPSGDARRTLLEVTCVHPMRREAVEALLAGTKEDWSVVDRLLLEGYLDELVHRGTTFYVRRLPGR